MLLRNSLAALLLVGLLPLASCASDDADTDDVWELADASADYPLETCAVSGKPLDEGRVAVRYEGEEVQLHCENDLDAFLADPEPALAKVRAARGR